LKKKHQASTIKFTGANKGRDQCSITNNYQEPQIAKERGSLTSLVPFGTSVPRLKIDPVKPA
jgi:hypothetical protein